MMATSRCNRLSSFHRSISRSYYLDGAVEALLDG